MVAGPTGAAGSQGATGPTGAAGGGGGSSVAAYLSTGGFPATGSASVLYLNTSTSRLYRWVSADSVYAEVGTSGLSDTLDGGTYGS